jgi:glycosyltransferase involved in cell wall biosynthesis
MPSKVNHPHIVIDARLYGPRHTGLGRYTKNLLIALTNLPEFDRYRFTLIIYPELKTEIKKDLGNKFEYYVTRIRHYTFAEQFFLPLILWSLQPSLVHFTHLDKPILYFGKSVVTVHDLIRHFSKGSDTTTRSPLLYWPKYWGYLLMSSFIIRFNHLIVPSNFWRNYIIDYYHVDPSRIVTTYEAVDPSIIAPQKKSSSPPQNYLLYTGNLYPHKNIEVVFRSLQKIPSLKLKIICARDVFHERAVKLTAKLGLTKQVDFLGYIPDEEFINVYQKALALVHPAFLEGFSLTGLEAMALGTPVIAANSSCLPEIYEKSVLYFDPKNPDDLVKVIKQLQKKPTLRKELIGLGYNQVAKYSWTKTAAKTLSFYHDVISTNG